MTFDSPVSWYPWYHFLVSLVGVPGITAWSGLSVNLLCCLLFPLRHSSGRSTREGQQRQHQQQQSPICFTVWGQRRMIVISSCMIVIKKMSLNCMLQDWHLLVTARLFASLDAARHEFVSSRRSFITQERLTISLP